MDRPRSFIESTQKPIVKQESPNAIVHLFETHVFCFQNSGDEQHLMAESDRTVCAHLPHFGVARIVRFGTSLGPLSVARSVAAGRHVSIQRLVRANLIILLPKLVETVLLLDEARLRRAGRFLLDPACPFPGDFQYRYV